jgi:hypothetical protein
VQASLIHLLAGNTSCTGLPLHLLYRPLLFTSWQETPPVQYRPPSPPPVQASPLHLLAGNTSCTALSSSPLGMKHLLYRPDHQNSVNIYTSVWHPPPTSLLYYAQVPPLPSPPHLSFSQDTNNWITRQRRQLFNTSLYRAISKTISQEGAWHHFNTVNRQERKYLYFIIKPIYLDSWGPIHQTTKTTTYTSGRHPHGLKKFLINHLLIILDRGLEDNKWSQQIVNKQRP